MGGLLAVLFFAAVVMAAGSAPQSPAPERTGPFHWHRPHGVNKKYYFEQIGTSHDGYPQLQCPFCNVEYVNRS